LTAASTWQRAGQPKKAQQVLAALKTEQKRTDAEVAGSEIAITWKEGGALDWLKRVVGESMPIGVSLVNHWLMYRGSDDRNTACDGGRPLLMERWAQRTVNIPSVERLIEKLDESYRRQEIATLPAMHPLAIGDLVVTRTLQRVIGVDFETGKRVWELRTGSSDDSLERLIKISRNEAKVAQMPQLTARAAAVGRRPVRNTRQRR